MSKKEKKVHYKETQDGFRKGITKKDIIKDLNDEDWKRIAKTKELQTMKPDTYSYKIAVLCDQLRRKNRDTKQTLEKMIIQIYELIGSVKRLEEQVKIEHITEELKTGVRMNIEEAKTHIIRLKWGIQDEVNRFPLLLGELRTTVGHFDYSRKIIMTEEDFDKFVEKLETQLKNVEYSMWEV